MSFSIFLVLIIIVSLLLILTVMVQNPKTGGLSSSLTGGSTQLGGVQKTTDFLEKATWALAGTLIALIIVSSISFVGNTGDSKITAGEEDTKPNTIPAAKKAPSSEPIKTLDTTKK
jgi:preprotein translocase subunit SecG